jgi:superfamily I DNA/RNA helicase
MVTTSFKPSKYQQAIFDFVPSNNSNLVINALAGSGKTTTLEQLLHYIPNDKSRIFCAFNRGIVKELSERISKSFPGVEVKTMHSFGFSAIRYSMGSSVIVDEEKTMKYIRNVFMQWNVAPQFSEGYMVRVRGLVNIAKLSLCKDIDELFDRAEHYGVEIMDRELEHAWEVFEATRRDRKVIDMTDMIYYPVYYKMKVRQFHYVLIDEVQDLNKCQQEIMKMMLRPDGRFIAVGDPRQAIYGFAGADEESFNNLTLIPNTKVLPLSVNYRCGKKILEMVKDIVPEIEPSEQAIEGEVQENCKWQELQEGDFVICRNVRPLVSLCLDLLIADKKAFVKGRDIGKNLVNMLTKPKKAKFDDTMKVLRNELDKMVQKGLDKGKTYEEVTMSAAYQTHLDKVEALEVIGQYIEKTEDVVAKISTLFDEDRPGIILSTIHKAKGLEADRVFILCKELMPSKWARKAWEIEQENNLIYVAYTRAKKLLGFIDNYEL